jgi:hypothetical protein
MAKDVVTGDNDLLDLMGDTPDALDFELEAVEEEHVGTGAAKPEESGVGPP